MVKGQTTSYYATGGGLNKYQIAAVGRGIQFLWFFSAVFKRSYISKAPAPPLSSTVMFPIISKQTTQRKDLMNRGYIARKYVGREIGGKYLYEEGIFSSYESAYDFIQEISEEDEDCFLSEIVSYPIDSTSPWDHDKYWIFDRKGKLLHSYDVDKRYDNCKVVDHDGYKSIHPEPEPESYTGKFKEGDLVFVRAFPWNKYSYRYFDMIGVVVSTPVHYEVWISDEKDKYDWGNDYVIYFVLSGYLDHIHVEERGIEHFQEELPDNLEILKYLSAHFQGANIFKDGILEKIVDGKIFVEKVRFFNEDDLIKT